jgi:hypothetical protein
MEALVGAVGVAMTLIGGYLTVREIVWIEIAEHGATNTYLQGARS